MGMSQLKMAQGPYWLIDILNNPFCIHENSYLIFLNSRSVSLIHIVVSPFILSFILELIILHKYYDYEAANCDLIY